MEIKQELEWEKFEKRFDELEARIALRSGAGRRSSAPAVEESPSAAFGMSARMEKLEEEIAFLKAEIEKSQRERDEAASSKEEIENLIRHKDSEITKLFARAERFSGENSGLKTEIKKQDFEAAAETCSRRRHHHHHRHGKDGLFSWLRKPLVAIGS